MNVKLGRSYTVDVLLPEGEADLEIPTGQGWCPIAGGAAAVRVTMRDRHKLGDACSLDHLVDLLTITNREIWEAEFKNGHLAHEGV